jgi:hypothetical protein
MAKSQVTDDILKKLTALSSDVQVALTKLTEVTQALEKQSSLIQDMKASGPKSAKKSAGAKKAAALDDGDKALDSAAWWKKKYINDPEGTKKTYLKDEHLAAIKKEVESLEDYKSADAANKALKESVFIYEKYLLDKKNPDLELKRVITAEFKAYKDNWTKKDEKPTPPSSDSAPKPAVTKGKGKAKSKAKAPPKPEPEPVDEDAEDAEDPEEPEDE